MAGDALLLECSTHFVKYHLHDQDFAMVTPLNYKSVWKKQRLWKTIVTVVATLAMVIINSTGVTDLVTAALCACCVLIALRCVKTHEAAEAIQGELLVLIACAFSLGRALEITGAAEVIADALLVVVEPIGIVGILGACAFLIGVRLPFGLCVCIDVLHSLPAYTPPV